MAAAKKKEKKVRQDDPISDRARALNDQIAALESEIKKLDTQIQKTPVPKLRSTAIPHGVTVSRKSETSPAAKPLAHEPIFEEIKPLRAGDESITSDQYNELGVRKYDLPALIRRIRNYFSRPTANNPRLVTYLAAGGVHGLRPLRYEKRVARNRFIFFTTILFLILLGIILTVAKHR